MKWNNSIEMTGNEKSFFKKPRTMQDIIGIFEGDQWAANDYQNKRLNTNQLKIVLMDNPLGKQYAKIIGFQLA